MARVASGDDMLIARLNAAGAGHEIKRRDSRSTFRPVAAMHPTELRAAHDASFIHHSASSVIDTCASPVLTLLIDDLRETHPKYKNVVFRV